MLEIPPPVFDLDIRLDCGDGALPGDVNCSGETTAIDAALVLQFTAALVGSLACEDAGDVNESGSVDSIDSLIILQFTAGLIPSLPV